MKSFPVRTINTKSRRLLVDCGIAAGISVLLTGYNSMVVHGGNILAVVRDYCGIGIWTALFFIAISLIILLCRKAGADRIFRARYVIAAVLFVACVSLEITGSSIGVFTNGNESNVLFGVSRPIRSDEWGVFTPMIWSQYLDPNGAFSYYSSVIRADTTDVFIEYGLPVASILMIYKPFLIGYLFLPVAKGMAFFWCGRAIVLFMASFEFGRFITKDDRRLSLVYAVVMLFSPCVQWWFAINGFVEMLIFAQVSILCFDRYLKCNITIIRSVYAVAIGICAGGFALTMYPAWMVPLAYVILFLAIWVFADNISNGTASHISVKDIVVIVIVLALLVLTATYVYDKSGQTIKTIMNTVYPGSRVTTGGGTLGYIFHYVTSLTYAMWERAPYINVCESSHFISLFPAGFLLYIVAAIKERRRDLLCDLLCLLGTILLIYCVIGFPQRIAEITLLSKSFANRALMIFELVNLLLLFRVLAIHKGEETMKPSAAAFVSTIIAAIAMVLNYKTSPDYYFMLLVAVDFAILATLYYGAIRFSSRVSNLWMMEVAGLCLIAGLLVNPVRAGADDIRSMPEYRAIETVVEQEPDAIWIAEGVEAPYNNTLLLNGARTINSTNVYPDLERWRAIDPKREYEDCYNRYAHIKVIYTDEKVREKFELNYPDYFTVYLNSDDLKKLDVEYIYSVNDLSYNDSFELQQSGKGFNIYRIK